MNQPDVKLTKNFYLHEFAKSDNHPELAEAIKFSAPDVAKAGLLAKLLLQPIREEYGRVSITSGKRSAELNDAVGGWELSHHLFLDDEAACDFTVPEARSITDVWHWCMLHFGFSYGMLLVYPDRNFIHYSLPCAKWYGLAKIKRGSGGDTIVRGNRV